MMIVAKCSAFVSRSYQVQAKGGNPIPLKSIVLCTVQNLESLWSIYL